MGSTSKALIVFARFPETGKVKTRLAPAVGADEACRIYERLCRRTLGIAADFKRTDHVHVFLFFTPPGKESQVRRAFPGPWEFLAQEGSHLGNCMENAFRSVRDRGCHRIVLIGSDILDLEARDLEDAFSALGRDDAVLGPSEDGGYYLIGLTRPCQAAFATDEWGTAGVCGRTARILRESGFTLRTITKRRDIDRPEDLKHIHKAGLLKKLSVVIPTLAPPERLSPLFDRLSPVLWPEDEIVVVRGTTEDQGGIERPAAGIILARSPVGRGLQLNRGAELSSGDVLFFLHDDCVPPPSFACSVRKIFAEPRKSLGCFRLGFSPAPSLLPLIEKWANLRTRLFSMPYGDQGLFCTRETFEAVGGFRKKFILEDVDFVERCSKRGGLLVLPDTIFTSSRRYLDKGILRASMQNHRIMLLYRLGVDDVKLHSDYYR